MKEDRFYTKLPFLVAVVFAGTLLATLQSFLLPLKTFEDSGLLYTEFNNYVIFKHSFVHLIDHQNLYTLYPKEQWDLFKYSPSFALLMAPFYWMPNFFGLLIWNLLNSMILLWGIWKLPIINNRYKFYIVFYVLIELITSIQNTQSNALIAGCILLTFAALEHKKVWVASLLIVCTVFIKLFGLVALALFILYPKEWKKAAFFTTLWFLVFFFLPIIVISPQELIGQYKNWGVLLKNDQEISYGLSVMGWMYTWFNLEWNKSYVVSIGAILFCLPLLRYKLYSQIKFRMFFLSSILLWVIIFNHRAESPTFIIAVTGIAIWYFCQRKSIVNTALVIFAFIFTVLSATDIFPRVVKTTFLFPYVMKAVPCIFIWLKLSVDLLLYKSLSSDTDVARN